MRATTIFAAASLVAALLSPGGAHAQPAPAAPRPAPRVAPWLTGWYAPSGVAIGASIHPERPNGLVVGLEQSLVYQVGPRASWWGGVSAEALYDFGPSWGRVAVGPELGYGIVGLDGGFLALWRGQHAAEGGVQGRLLVTIGVAAVYGRLATVWGDERFSFGEAGVLLKWPWSLGGPPRLG